MEVLIAQFLVAQTAAQVASSPPMEATLTWPAIGVLVGVMVMWSTLMLIAVQRINEAQHNTVNVRVSQAEGLIARLEAKQAETERSLIREYIRREDWIRSFTSISASIDRMDDLLRGDIAALRAEISKKKEPSGGS